MSNHEITVRIVNGGGFDLGRTPAMLLHRPAATLDQLNDDSFAGEDAGSDKEEFSFEQFAPVSGLQRLFDVTFVFEVEVFGMQSVFVFW